MQSEDHEFLYSNDPSEANVTYDGNSYGSANAQLIGKRKKLSGAGRKRFKWLLSQGLTQAEARVKAMQQVPESLRTSQKRVHSEESSSGAKDKKIKKKKQKVQKSSPKSLPATYSTSEFNYTKVVVVQANSAEDNLNDLQVTAIQKRILQLISEKAGPPYPAFSGVEHLDGCLSLLCDDKATSDWLKSIICDVKPWEGAELKVEDEENDFVVFSACFPKSAFETTETILKLVKEQNSNINSSEWKVLKRTNEGGDTHLILSLTLNDDLDILYNQDYKVNFAFGKVQLY